MSRYKWTFRGRHFPVVQLLALASDTVTRQCSNRIA